MPKASKAHKVENKPYIEAMRGIRSSSAASPHEDARTKRARTRSTAITKAVKEFNE